MKKLLMFILISTFSLTAVAFDEIVSQDQTTEVFKSRGRYKRAKKRSQKRHGIYHSKCMRTKRIRVRN